MYRIGILDVREEYAELEEWLRAFGERLNYSLDIIRWTSEEELLATYEDGRKPDILYLEAGEEGISLGGRLRERGDCKSLQLLYLAPDKAYYEGLIQTRPADFLLLPLSKDEVIASFRKILNLVKDENEIFMIRRGKEAIFLPMKDIVYICSECEKMLIKTLEREYEYLGRLKDVIPILPEEFLHIHRSYLINKNHVWRYEYEILEMDEGTVFSISRPNRKMVRQILLDRAKQL